MALINTGVNYPIERGGSGKFKALSTVTSMSMSISNTAPITIAPSLGNAIVLFGLLPISGTPTITVAGSLYGNIVDAKSLGVSASAGLFYIAENYGATTVPSIINGVPAILFETDEVVSIIKGGGVGTTDLYVSYQEGYIL